MTDPFNPKLVASLCHDLRGPLGAVGTWIHVLNSGKAKPETQTQALGAMANDVQAMGALIEQLSLLGAILSGDEPVALTPVDLVSVVRSACASLPQHGDVQVSFSSAEDALPVSADAGRLQQLIALLTSRALTGRAGNRALSVSRNEATAELSVSTNGGGPRALSVALARALAECQGGRFTPSSDASSLAVLLPLTT